MFLPVVTASAISDTKVALIFMCVAVVLLIVIAIATVAGVLSHLIKKNKK